MRLRGACESPATAAATEGLQLETQRGSVEGDRRPDGAFDLRWVFGQLARSLRSAAPAAAKADVSGPRRVSALRFKTEEGVP